MVLHVGLYGVALIVVAGLSILWRSLRLPWFPFLNWVLRVRIQRNMTLEHVVRRDRSCSGWRSRLRLFKHVFWLSNRLFNPLLYLIDSTFSIQTITNNIICEHKLVKLLLQIGVLKCKQVSMILQSIKFLFKAVTHFLEIFVICISSIKFTA